MSFEIKVDADACLKQFDSLIENLAGLDQDVPATFVDWQSDDMHRRFPKVEGSGLSVSTSIFPRSRLQRTKNLTGGGKSTRRRSIIAAGRPSSHRPILRPELFEKLKQRMVDMMKEAATWQ